MSVRSALSKNLASELPLDTHPEVRLDFDHVRQAAQQRLRQALPAGRSNIVRTKARRFKAAMPRVQPHYAVKANPDPPVLQGPDRGRRRLRDRLDRRARPAARPGRAGRRDLLQQPDEVARLPASMRRQRASSGSCWTASRSCARSIASSPTPSSTCASMRPTSAATGRLSGKFGAHRPTRPNGIAAARAAARPTWPA